MASELEKFRLRGRILRARSMPIVSRIRPQAWRIGVRSLAFVPVQEMQPGEYVVSLSVPFIQFA